MSDLTLASLSNWFLQNHPAANIEPPAPQGWAAPLPTISVNSLGQGRPRMDASLGVPAFGGELAVEGNYHRPDERSPASWAAMLGYRRSF